MPPTLSAIIYKPDGTLLFCVPSNNLEDAYFETDLDKSLVKINYLGDLPVDFSYDQCYNYSLVKGILVSNAFTTNPITFYQLLQAKLSCINLLMRNIVRWRKKLFNNDSFYQDHVYALKYNQALAYKNSGYDVTTLSNYPLVQCDTIIHSVSGQVAADKIISTYLYFEKYLVTSEVKRVTFRHAIWNATTIEVVATLKTQISKL